MNCTSFRDALLTCEVEGLGGELSCEQKRHVAECPACAASVTAIRTGMQGLGDAIESIAPPIDADTAISLARPRVRRRPRPRTWPRLRRSTGRRLSWAVPAVVAAGPIVWLVFFAGREQIVDVASPIIRVAALQQAETGGEPTSSLEADVEPEFSISTPDSGRVAVFQTSNPKIRVVWFYDEGSDE
jgi:anti-sigma factor RsiW